MSATLGKPFHQWCWCAPTTSSLNKQRMLNTGKRNSAYPCILSQIQSILTLTPFIQSSLSVNMQHVTYIFPSLFKEGCWLFQWLFEPPCWWSSQGGQKRARGSQRDCRRRCQARERDNHPRRWRSSRPGFDWFLIMFLAVQNSSIGDLVTHSLTDSVTFWFWHYRISLRFSLGFL